MLGARLTSATLSLFALFCAPCTRADDFKCPDVMPDVMADLKYQRLSKPTRCEGYYTREVSQSYVELVSLVSGELSDPPAGSAGISLKAVWLPEAGQKARLLIQPLGARPLYRVDIPVGHELIAWDHKPMLEATGLKLSRIGFLAVLPDLPNARPAFTPVSSSASDGDSPVTATVRVSVKVRSMRYRVIAPVGSGIPKAWQRVPDMPLYAWDSARIKLPIRSAGGPYRIEVEAVDESDKKLPLLRFNVAGNNGK